jgi:2-aminoadipate transaminase
VVRRAAAPPLTARNPEGCIYLGSFSKVLAPGLRLGFMVAPKAIFPKLLQAKQAADLHSPGFNQRLVFEVMQDGFLDRHVPTIRALYKPPARRDAAALEREMQGLGMELEQAGRRHVPVGCGCPPAWTRCDLLPTRSSNVAFVPGAPFYAGRATRAPCGCRS